MTGTFYVAHATGGRTRIRWAGDSAQKADVVKIAADIADVEGIEQAIPRITTGSIIIAHEQTEWEPLQYRLSDQLSLAFVAPPPAEPRTAMDTIHRGLGHVNGALKGVNTDLGSVSVFMLLILAVAQAYRGQTMSSAASFLWYALNLANIARAPARPDADTAADMPE